MTKQKTQKITKEIKGWLDDQEGELLYDLAQNCDDQGVIVEIGSYQGKSAVWLGAGSDSGSKTKVYTIDPHQWENNLGELKNNISKAELNDLIIPICQTSKSASQNFFQPINLLFIDGDHDFNAVKTDFEAWVPKIINNGLIAVHDAITEKHKGTRQIIEKKILKSKKFSNVQWVKTTLVAQKCQANFYNSLKKYILFILIHFKLIIVLRKIKNKTNKLVGQIGKFIKKHNPALYYQLKKWKK